MCEWGKDNEVLLRVKVSAKKSYTGKERWAIRGIDKCIAPIIKALTKAGIYTDESCCGHGKLTGYIALHDGRILVILPDKKAWDKYRDLIKVFPIIGIGGEIIMNFQKIEIKRKDGTVYKALSVIQFNKGYSHIIIDDGCYQIVNGDKISSHIFPEAQYVLGQLPNPNGLKHHHIYIKALQKERI